MKKLSNVRLEKIINRVDEKTQKEIGLKFSEIAETEPDILYKMTPSSISREYKDFKIKDIKHFMNLIYDFRQKYSKSIGDSEHKESVDNQKIVNYVSRHCLHYTENFMGFDSINPEDNPTNDMIEKMKRDNRVRLTLYNVNKLNGSRMSLIIPTSKTTERNGIDKNNWSHMAYAFAHDKGCSLLSVSFPSVDDTSSGLNKYYNKNARPIFSHSEIRSDNIGKINDGRFYVKHPSKPVLPHTQSIDNDFAGPLMSLDIKHGWYLDDNFETTNEKVSKIAERIREKQIKRESEKEHGKEKPVSPCYSSGPSF